MKLSRQREYQQRHRAAGLCILCSKPAVNELHCEIHIMKVRLRSRRRMNCKAWKKGRPPLEPQ